MLAATGWSLVEYLSERGRKRYFSSGFQAVIYLDTGRDGCPRFYRGPGQPPLRKVLLENPVVASEIPCVLQVNGGLDNVVQRTACECQDALAGQYRRMGFRFDRAADHIAVLVFGHLPGQKHKVPRAHRRVKRQIRVLLAVDLYIRLGHWVTPEKHSMMSSPCCRSTK